MRTISFNKLDENSALCITCKKNKVPLGQALRPCKSCRKTAGEEIKGSVKLGQRMPAAVVKNEKGHAIFVDKFGNRVDNPGYDLKRDPRGHKFTGGGPKKRTII